jgi:hypothetical protein
VLLWGWARRGGTAVRLRAWLAWLLGSAWLAVVVPTVALSTFYRGASALDATGAGEDNGIDHKLRSD